MKPYWVRDLPLEQQEEVQKMIQGVLLSICGGDTYSFQSLLGEELEIAVNRGMESKISSLDEIVTIYFSQGIDLKYQMANAECISTIWKSATGQHVELFSEIESEMER